MILTGASNPNSMGLVAFVADALFFPGPAELIPLACKTETIIPFISPDSFRVSVSLPNRGNISGLGIPKVVILILGGGYYGKSTLFNALVLGVCNHVPGGGREFCITSKGAVKIRAARSDTCCIYKNNLWGTAHIFPDLVVIL